MNKNLFPTADRAGLALGIAFVATLLGCTREAPVQEIVAASPPAVAAAAPSDGTSTTVVMPDDYVYYPNYEVYYSNNRHEYRYRDGNSWVSRATPPHVSAEVVLASPSVRMDFHDAPERHHDTVVRSYPKNWTPPAGSRDDKDDKKHN